MFIHYLSVNPNNDISFIVPQAAEVVHHHNIQVNLTLRTSYSSEKTQRRYIHSVVLEFVCKCYSNSVSANWGGDASLNLNGKEVEEGERAGCYRTLFWNFFFCFSTPPSKIPKLLLVHELCISGGLEEHRVPATPPHPSCIAVGRYVCVRASEFGRRDAQAPLCLPAAPPCRETRHPLQEVQRSASPVPQGTHRKHTQTHTRRIQPGLSVDPSIKYTHTHNYHERFASLTTTRVIITIVHAYKHRDT